MIERKLFVAQRVTAVLLAPLVLIHLGLILYAVKGGLTAGEILARTEGNVLWALFYGLFVLCVSIHAPVGMRNILNEWTSLPPALVNIVAVVLFALFLLLGLRAVAAVS